MDFISLNASISTNITSIESFFCFILLRKKNRILSISKALNLRLKIYIQVFQCLKKSRFCLCHLPHIGGELAILPCKLKMLKETKLEKLVNEMIITRDQNSDYLRNIVVLHCKMQWGLFKVLWPHWNQVQISCWCASYWTPDRFREFLWPSFLLNMCNFG